MAVVLLLYSGNSLLERAIERVTHSRYCHAAIAVDGVVYEEQAHGLLKHVGDDAKRVAGSASAHKEIPVGNGGAEAMTTFYERLVAAHAGYNYVQLLSDLIEAMTGVGLTVAYGDDMVCSAAVAAGLMLAGYAPVKEIHRVTPEDLAEQFQPLTAGPPVL